MGTRQLFAALFSVLLVLQAVLPASAGANGMGDPVEICSEFGVTLVYLDENGNQVDSGETSCPECGDCPLCAITALGDFPREVVLTSAADLGQQAFLIAAQSLATNPAQFWADNRGPPRRTEKAIDLAMTLFMGLPLNEGRAPWI